MATVGIVGGVLELLQRVEEVGAGEVVGLEDLEAVFLQFGGDRLGVGHRVVELRQGLVVAVADDQRHPPRLGGASRRRDRPPAREARPRIRRIGHLMRRPGRQFSTGRRHVSRS